MNAQTRSILQVQLDYQLRCAEGQEGQAAALAAQAEAHAQTAADHRAQAADIERSLRVLDAVFTHQPDALAGAAASNGAGAAGDCCDVREVGA